MAKLKSFTLDLGYPIYGSKFVNGNTLIVAGGGGEGNNGIPNKITALLIQPDNPKKPIKRFRELVLNDKEDCPMSLDVNNNMILVGINENSESIKRGINKHLRKFRYQNEHLKFVESCQIHPSNNSSVYQKLTCLTKDGNLGVIAISDNPSSLYIVDTSDNLEEKFKIFTAGDVKDISISPDGKMMCYITSTHFEAISTITGRSVFKTELSFTMSKIAFYDNNAVIIAGSNKAGIVLGEFLVNKSSISKTSVVARNMKGITSIDVNPKSGIVSLAGSDCSILLVRVKDFKLLKKLEKVHGFAITKITSSEDGKYIASVSAANTVNIQVIPPNYSTSKSFIASAIQLILTTILVALLAIAAQFLYTNGYIEKVQEKIIQYYKSKRPADSSSYFTIQPIESSDVFVDGSATTTYFPADQTVGNDYITTSETSTYISSTSTSSEDIVELETDSFLETAEDDSTSTEVEVVTETITSSVDEESVTESSSAPINTPSSSSLSSSSETTGTAVVSESKKSLTKPKSKKKIVPKSRTVSKSIAIETLIETAVQTVLETSTILVSSTVVETSTSVQISTSVETSIATKTIFLTEKVVETTKPILEDVPKVVESEIEIETADSTVETITAVETETIEVVPEVTFASETETPEELQTSTEDFEPVTAVEEVHEVNDAQSDSVLEESEHTEEEEEEAESEHFEEEEEEEVEEEEETDEHSDSETHDEAETGEKADEKAEDIEHKEQAEEEDSVQPEDSVSDDESVEVLQETVADQLIEESVTDETTSV